jgi:hypothetical protein
MKLKIEMMLDTAELRTVSEAVLRSYIREALLSRAIEHMHTSLHCAGTELESEESLAIARIQKENLEIGKQLIASLIVETAA